LTICFWKLSPNPPDAYVQRSAPNDFLMLKESLRSMEELY
jgi:hypothetical protein